MNKVLYILFFAFAFASGFGQKDSLRTISADEKMPEFAGGNNNLVSYLQKTVIYPKAALEKGIEGKTFVRFLIRENGKVDSVRVLKTSGSPLLDSEAVRVVSIMPNWNPGTINGTPVKVQFSLPVNFKNEKIASHKESNAILYRTGYGYTDKKKSIFFDKYNNAIVLPHDKYSKLPEYAGGNDSLENFIRRNFKRLPDDFVNLEHPSMVEFDINEDGSVSNEKIITSCGSVPLDNETLRILKLCNAWSPAIKESAPCKVKCKVPINLIYLFGETQRQLSSAYKKEKADYYYNLGVKYFGEKNYKIALYYFDECLKINNADIDALYNKAVAHLKLNEIEKACFDWNKIKALGKPDADELLKKYCNK